ncbi:hypothetical protein K0M31_017707 [Melipona bicolor]|uniref:Zeta-sarcoglycan n=1 Tax=Melipona bicolor TaxID=60889 RepID=A0AA40G5D9_9HYME|nr:hypothetical protein K0M31_017707 [Melipona bicolor]
MFPLNTLDDTQATARSSPMRGWSFPARNKILPAPTVPILCGRYFKRARLGFPQWVRPAGGGWEPRPRSSSTHLLFNRPMKQAIMSTRWYLIFVPLNHGVGLRQNIYLSLWTHKNVVKGEGRGAEEKREMTGAKVRRGNGIRDEKKGNGSAEGIGSLKVVPGGIELRGQAAVLDALVASSLRSRRGKNLVLESWSNFTASARSHDGRLLARFTVGEDRVDCVSRSFRITDPRGGILFSADREQVVVGAEMLRVTGDGGAVFQGSVQTPLVRGESGRGLRLESATRSLKISAPQRVVIESWANEISASCLTDLKLQSVHGAIKLDAKTLFMKGLKTASPSQGHSSREQQQQQQQQQQHSSRTSSHQSQRDTTIYQLCACANGKLFLARSEGTCQADKSIC